MDARKQALAQHLQDREELKKNSTSKTQHDIGRLLDFSLHQPSVLLDSEHERIQVAMLHKPAPGS